MKKLFISIFCIGASFIISAQPASLTIEAASENENYLIKDQEKTALNFATSFFLKNDTLIIKDFLAQTKWAIRKYDLLKYDTSSKTGIILLVVDNSTKEKVYKGDIAIYLQNEPKIITTLEAWDGKFTIEYILTKLVLNNKKIL
ncbi:MAG: hypothetical protein KF825_00185 [Ferruginibacter sp.]|nr:hypothetical protein [Ferruginibacter sp.]MBX2932628.1 hypothetical protein [Ferruginibacter sp.]